MELKFLNLNFIVSRTVLAFIQQKIVNSLAKTVRLKFISALSARIIHAKNGSENAEEAGFKWKNGLRKKLTGLKVIIILRALEKNRQAGPLITEKITVLSISP